MTELWATYRLGISRSGASASFATSVNGVSAMLSRTAGLEGACFLIGVDGHPAGLLAAPPD